MEETLKLFFANAPFLVSFLAGIITFVSPCVLPLIPAYISYISGLSIKQLNGSEVISATQRAKIVLSAFMFTLGFGVVFVLLGSATANIIGDIFEYQWITWIAGGIIFIFGLHISGLISINFLNFQGRANFGDTKSRSLFAPFILGLSFALGWTPCVGPIFAAIVFKAAQDPSQAVWLMVVYALGLAIPFLLTALLTSFMLGLMNKIKQYFRVIEIISGSLLAILGVAIATGGVGRLTALFMGG
jgi:cytochrome c-type biogenesis protein